MSAVTKFLPETITDQKRLARGEQLLYARNILRMNHEKHNAAWKLLILPGSSPHEEVNAIKELFPKAHITALDRDPLCLELAIDAGVDDVIQAELALLKTQKNNHHGYPSTTYHLPEGLEGRRFDLMIVDTCSKISSSIKSLLTKLHQTVIPGGALVFNVMYGRDVVEMFQAKNFKNEEANAKLDESEMPEMIRKRLVYMTGAGMANRIVGVITYLGKVPMMSVIYSKRVWRQHISYVGLEPGDFELSVALPDPTKLYACPQDRIESLRRSHAAIKAAYTKKLGVSK